MKKKIYLVIVILFVFTGLWWIKGKYFSHMKSQKVDKYGFKANYFKKGNDRNKTTVIIIGGGPFGDFWGSEFAGAGHIGLSLPYHRLDGLPEKIEEIPLEYFEKAINWLISQPEVNPDKILVMGGSVNAELALLLASVYPNKISGVIAYCPSSVVWSNTVYPWSSDEVKPKWTLKGQAIPYLAMEKIKGNDTDKIETLSYWNKGLDDVAQVEQAAIMVEKINGPILLLTPIDDKVWPSLRMSEMIEKRLRENNFRYRVENVKYKDAGHTITAQYNKSITNQKGKLWIDGKAYEFEYGGSPSGILLAQGDSRKRVMDYVSEL